MTSLRDKIGVEKISRIDIKAGISAKNGIRGTPTKYSVTYSNGSVKVLHLTSTEARRLRDNAAIRYIKRTTKKEEVSTKTHEEQEINTLIEKIVAARVKAAASSSTPSMGLVKSNNRGYGYHGVFPVSVADKKYSDMHAKVKKLASAAGHLDNVKNADKTVTHYLDSSYGKQIAGHESDHSVIKSDFKSFKRNYKENVDQNDTGENEINETAEIDKDILLALIDEATTNTEKRSSIEVVPRPSPGTAPNESDERKRNRMQQIKIKIIDEENQVTNIYNEFSKDLLDAATSMLRGDSASSELSETVDIDALVSSAIRLNEGDDAPRLRLVKTHTNGNRTAKVYKDKDWDEYRVKHYTDGKHHVDADSHHDDVGDAHGTAQHWMKGAKKIEETTSKKAMVKVDTQKEVGYRISDIGSGGKEHNVKTNAAWVKKHSGKSLKNTDEGYSSYSGNKPNNIHDITSTSDPDVVMLHTNDGRKHRVHAKRITGARPRIGDHIGKYRESVEPDTDNGEIDEGVAELKQQLKSDKSKGGLSDISRRRRSVATAFILAKIKQEKNKHESTEESQDEINESSGMSVAAKELTLHAANDEHLHHSSHVPIMKNLERKVKSGSYDHGKAQKLWGYHADRAAHSYAKEHGTPSVPWHKMFSKADRKQAAKHFADNAKDELVNEEVGHANELSKATLVSYTGDVVLKRKLLNKEETETDMNTKDESMFTDAELARLEQINDDLKEGRGRPPKEGSVKWHARQAADASGEEKDTEADQHPLMHIKRAADNDESKTKFKHKSGEVSQINHVLAKHILAKHDALKKPEDKDALIGKIHHSQTSMRTALTGK